MTREELYEKLEEEMKKVDWDDLQSIRKYNDYARMLRSQYEWAKD